MFYNLAISLYEFAAKVAALFSSKPAKMLEGQKRAFMYLLNNLDPYDKHIWVHAASLGEFEQGRPLIERIRKDYPKYKIVLTFFSPSGYEVRKDYKGADYVCYLPFDTRRNVGRFLDMLKPEKAFFIKYEFWPNFLAGLKKRGVPTYSVSSIFRKEQTFFRAQLALAEFSKTAMSMAYLLVCSVDDGLVDVVLCGACRLGERQSLGELGGKGT